MQGEFSMLVVARANASMNEFQSLLESSHCQGEDCASAVLFW